MPPQAGCMGAVVVARTRKIISAPDALWAGLETDRAVRGAILQAHSLKPSKTKITVKGALHESGVMPCPAGTIDRDPVQIVLRTYTGGDGKQGPGPAGPGHAAGSGCVRTRPVSKGERSSDQGGQVQRNTYGEACAVAVGECGG
jgi:hypothetical protein